MPDHCVCFLRGCSAFHRQLNWCLFWMCHWVWAWTFIFSFRTTFTCLVPRANSGDAMCRGRWADLGTLALTEMATHGSAPYTTLQLLLVQLQIYLTTHHGCGGGFSWIHIEPGYTIFASSPGCLLLTRASFWETPAPNFFLPLVSILEMDSG